MQKFNDLKFEQKITVINRVTIENEAGDQLTITSHTPNDYGVRFSPASGGAWQLIDHVTPDQVDAILIAFEYGEASVNDLITLMILNRKK